MSPHLVLISLFITVLNVSECRVKFTYSSIYDEFDFIGKTSVEIEECSGVSKCVLFVSVLNDKEYQDVYDNLYIAPDDSGKWNETISRLAAYRNKQTKAIDPFYITDDTPKPSTKIFLYNDNDKQIAAPLVIYAVNLEKEPNFINTALFDASDISEGVIQGKIVTILSAMPFAVTITSEPKVNTIATIFATGFDNADVDDENPDNCRRVMQTRFDEDASFQINGPITSIYFTDFDGKLSDSKNNIKASITFSYDNLDLKSRGFVTSQGYIGCQSGQVYSSSLYIYDDVIQYSLFNKESHSVHLTAFVNTDDEHPLNVQTDLGLINFNGHDPLASERACFDTHKLEALFNQTLSNSYALVYSYSNTNCDDIVVTTPSKLATPTIKPTSGGLTSKGTSIGIDATTPTVATRSTTIVNEPTTSSSNECHLLILLLSVVTLF